MVLHSGAAVVGATYFLFLQNLTFTDSNIWNGGFEMDNKNLCCPIVCGLLSLFWVWYAALSFLQIKQIAEYFQTTEDETQVELTYYIQMHSH